MNREEPRDRGESESRAEACADLERDEFLTTLQLAELLNVTARTVERMRSDGSGPPFVKLGPKLVRYNKRCVLAFCQARSFARVSEYEAVHAS